VLLELLTGRRALDKSKPVSEQNLVDWARPYLGEKRRLYRIMDSKLGGQYPKKGAHAVAGIALQCIRNEGKMRPAMSEVVEKLEQLQDPKYNMAAPQVNTRQTSSPSSSGSVPRSPIKAQPSPRRLSGSASPLPAAAAGSPLRGSCRTAQVH
jgi:interleukin-1 receptor-associated kinase 4